VANNSGNLAGWVSDPHSIKPGNKMPPSDLTGAELQALLTYLESLE
jgi:cytochrome c oxidase subunit 2